MTRQKAPLKAPKWLIALLLMACGAGSALTLDVVSARADDTVKPAAPYDGGKAENRTQAVPTAPAQPTPPAYNDSGQTGTGPMEGSSGSSSDDKKTAPTNPPDNHAAEKSSAGEH